MLVKQYDTYTFIYIYIQTSHLLVGRIISGSLAPAEKFVHGQKKGWRKMENGIFMVENDGNMMGKCWENDGKMLGK